MCLLDLILLCWVYLTPATTPSYPEQNNSMQFQVILNSNNKKKIKFLKNAQKKIEFNQLINIRYVLHKTPSYGMVIAS